jgi:hypothetical protein
VKPYPPIVPVLILAVLAVLIEVLVDVAKRIVRRFR